MRRCTAVLFSVAVAALVIGTAGCGEGPGNDRADAVQPVDPAEFPVFCSDCHGSERNPAPPRDVDGNDDVSLVTVGAHQYHLAPSGWHRDVVCGDCHVVPDAVFFPGHVEDPPAEITWGSIALADLATPMFDRESATCSGVYCHGGTLTGGSNNEPAWTIVNGGERMVCGTCHGMPPDPPHPRGTECSTCHGMVVDSRLRFVDPSLHINGEVDLEGLGCSSCHGSTESPAPPVDTAGNSAVTEVTVGAHQAHLGKSPWHRDVVCADCHEVPERIDDPGHIDSAPAELTWGTLAQADGARPGFDRVRATCQGVYCHGATLHGGGRNTVPMWTVVDGTQAACGTCHGLPPDPPHSPSSQCSACHGMVVGSDLGFVEPSLHINGEVNVSELGCSSCHGSSTNPAPPVDTSGKSDVAEVTVGAHQAHLAPASWHRDVLCEDCHRVPGDTGDAGHIDAGPAELTWSALARSDGAQPVFDRGSATCSGVYCHGATLSTGGTNTEPTWTVVDGGQAACGTCHGLPPEAPHPPSSACGNCHGMVIDGDLSFVDASLHINGEVNVAALSCNSCHGSEANPAPPVDTMGERAKAEVTVGAHQSHLGRKDWHREVLCNDCHKVPEQVGDPGHIDAAPSELTWGALAVTDGARPSFDRESATCSGVYCHGATLHTGGVNTRPKWTVVDHSQASCGTCHGLPPDPPHPQETRCSNCHDMVIDWYFNIVEPSLHINGKVEGNGGG